jgi:hypothetical protein
METFAAVLEVCFVTLSLLLDLMTFLSSIGQRLSASFRWRDFERNGGQNCEYFAKIKYSY